MTLGDSVITSGLKTSGYSEPSLGRFSDSGHTFYYGSSTGYPAGYPGLFLYLVIYSSGYTVCLARYPVGYRMLKITGYSANFVALIVSF
jgi:hypothetical protein